MTRAGDGKRRLPIAEVAHIVRLAARDGLRAELPDHLTPRQRSIAAARLQTLSTLVALSGARDLPYAAAVEALLRLARSRLCPQYLRRMLSAANARPNKKIPSRATLFLWLERYADEGLVALVPDRTGHEMQPAPAWANALVTRMRTRRNPRRSLKAILSSWPLNEQRPSYDQARQFLASLWLRRRRASSR